MSTSIEWTAVPDGKGGFKKGETLNPQVGCREVSPACRHCYAAGTAHRGMTAQHKGLTVVTANGVHWNGEVSRTPAQLAKPLSWKEPRGIFLGSMTDTFLRVETEDDMRWIAAQFGVMAATPRHTWMVLTKRPENAAKFFAWLDRLSEAEYRDHVDLCCEMAMDAMHEAGESRAANRLADIHGWAQDGDYYGGFDAGDESEVAGIARRKKRSAADAEGLDTEAWPLANVWIGTTVEDQQRADERIPLLLNLPAVVRFLSCEPLLGAVDLGEWLSVEDHCSRCGESGVSVAEHDNGADECLSCHAQNCTTRTWGAKQALDIQTGDRYANGGPGPDDDGPQISWVITGGESGRGARPAQIEWFRSIRDQCVAAGVAYFHKQNGEFKHVEPSGAPDDGGDMIRVGKAAAGRELDGRTWDEFPEGAR